MSNLRPNALTNGMPSEASDAPGELAALVRLSLGTPAGTALLEHLARRFLDRSLPPSSSDAELRHLEGQRSVVLYLRHLVATARRAPTGETE